MGLSMHANGNLTMSGSWRNSTTLIDIRRPMDKISTRKSIFYSKRFDTCLSCLIQSNIHVSIHHFLGRSALARPLTFRVHCADIVRDYSSNGGSEYSFFYFSAKDSVLALLS